MIIEKKVSIAIIDSGIDASVSDLRNYVVKETGFGVNPEGFISELKDIKPNGLHGTCVSLIIRNICKNVEFISINILNERMATDSRVMIFAMNEALKFEPDIIHMSLGTTNWKYRNYIKQIVREANEKQIIIVAACNNDGLNSYPSNMKGVIGVKSAKTDNHIYKDKKYYYAPFSMQNTGDLDNILGIEKMKGTSIATAYITGHIANIKSFKKLNNQIDVIKRFDEIIKIGGI
jgi:subtilisin family serine protease